jgi:hypothetical protein
MQRQLPPHQQEESNTSMLLPRHQSTNTLQHSAAVDNGRSSTSTSRSNSRREKTSHHTRNTLINFNIRRLHEQNWASGKAIENPKKIICQTLKLKGWLALIGHKKF